MTERSGNRKPRQIAPKDQTDQVADQKNAAQPGVTGVVGDASAAASRSGEDTRRRGWFWHWNHVITQYAPLLGLKGVGLLNSYTVWTDRREESPHRGYAFPSQQSEADFYGEDRAELITINKILVALDLIEIRKEMVYRVDGQGRRWKVPHNFYRVKDQGEGVSLTTDHVLRVIQLADKDRAVYRYLRKLFSPRFSPIDPDNVWHDILVEIRPTDVWQRLAARTERDESRASARSKAGHAARRTNDTSGVFSLPDSGDSPESKATVTDSSNDSSTGRSDSSADVDQTIVAATNNGSMTSVEQGNNGFGDNQPSSVALTNEGRPTSVAQTNTTYHQQKTTTTTTGEPTKIRDESAASPSEPDPGPESIPTVTPGSTGNPPDAQRDEDAAIRSFEEANNRNSTMAERRLLRGLAASFEQPAQAAGVTGWRWVADATDEAVGSGSRFVAPKRIREILNRWQAEGRDDATRSSEDDVVPVAQRPRQPVTSIARSSQGSRPAPERTQEVALPEPFAIEECGLSSRHVWNAALKELRNSPAFGRAGAETWLRDTHLIGRGAEGSLVVGVGNALALRRLAGRYLSSIREALASVTGVDCAVEIVDYREWRPADGQSLTGVDTA
jgi:hypothetical protein